MQIEQKKDLNPHKEFKDAINKLISLGYFQSDAIQEDYPDTYIYKYNTKNKTFDYISKPDALTAFNMNYNNTENINYNIYEVADYLPVLNDTINTHYEEYKTALEEIPDTKQIYKKLEPYFKKNELLKNPNFNPSNWCYSETLTHLRNNNIFTDGRYFIQINPEDVTENKTIHKEFLSRSDCFGFKGGAKHALRRFKEYLLKDLINISDVITPLRDYNYYSNILKEYKQDYNTINNLIANIGR